MWVSIKELCIGLMAMTFSANIWINLQYFSYFPPEPCILLVFMGIFGSIFTHLGIFLIELFKLMVFMVVFGGIYGIISTSFGIFQLNRLYYCNLCVFLVLFGGIFGEFLKPFWHLAPPN